MKIDEEKAKAFIDGIIELSKKYGLSLSHVDPGGDFEEGGFQIEPYDKQNIKWLKNCLKYINMDE